MAFDPSHLSKDERLLSEAEAEAQPFVTAGIPESILGDLIQAAYPRLLEIAARLSKGDTPLIAATLEPTGSHPLAGTGSGFLVRISMIEMGEQPVLNG